MTIEKQIEYLWNSSLERAIGAGVANPFDYADASVVSLEAKLRKINRLKVNGRLQQGSRAGRKQQQIRRAGR
jgi:hypothetical protein|tara:strand:+ start:125 stop:340 length:216 start_codon:yes stop_codon:yes gene_type:complete